MKQIILFITLALASLGNAPCAQASPDLAQLEDSNDPEAEIVFGLLSPVGGFTGYRCGPKNPKTGERQCCEYDQGFLIACASERPPRASEKPNADAAES